LKLYENPLSVNKGKRYLLKLILFKLGLKKARKASQFSKR